MHTTLMTRLSAFTLSTLFATAATLGVAFTMTDSGDRAHLAQTNAAQATVLTQARATPTL